jgi:hypothetical protein
MSISFFHNGKRAGRPWHINFPRSSPPRFREEPGRRLNQGQTYIHLSQLIPERATEKEPLQCDWANQIARGGGIV